MRFEISEMEMLLKPSMRAAVWESFEFKPNDNTIIYHNNFWDNLSFS